MFVIVPTFKTFPQPQFRVVLRLLVALFVTVHSAEDGQMAGSPHRHCSRVFWVLVTTPVTPLISALFTSVSFTNQKQNDLQKKIQTTKIRYYCTNSARIHTFTFCGKTQDTHTFELKIPKTSSYPKYPILLHFDSVSQLLRLISYGKFSKVHNIASTINCIILD